ncbi:hypothetical protein DFH94DRAFT_635391 [Russula ochroleuca]|uniref:ubiquitinyl hydrolase 1 n=1 Tax=Russula ochroleuca TaxID=152965 RepID=A0A9P5MNN5_9AGAM|nr:hypothetical protein DFH94DRAFT_635391 [Russula ochroleuca]
MCEIASHRPDSIAHAPVPLLTQPAHSPDASPHQSTSSGSTVSPQVKEPSIIPGHPSLSYSTKLSEIGDSSQPPAATSPALPVHTSPHPTDTSPPAAVAAALQVISPAATLPYSLEGSTKRDIVAPCTEPDITKILSTASLPAPTPAPTLVPVPASTPPVLIKSLESCDAGTASTFNPLLPVSPIVGFSITSPPPSCVSPLPNAESLALLRSTTPSRSTDNATLPRLRARGLVNTGSMCFVSAVLQLLVHSPPFWELFRELCDLKGQRGAGVPETDGGATPLVDATLRFLEEFTFKEKEPPPSQQPPQQVSGWEMREEKEANKVFNVDESFEPMYMYDAMKEKRHLKKLLEGQQQDVEEFFRLYLDALDEELLALLASISGHKSATTAPGVEEHEVSQSGQTDVEKQGTMAESIESPLQRIFGGKLRSTVRALNRPDTVNIEDWQSLQLDIRHDSVHDIENALARISHLLPVELSSSGSSEASQQVLIEALPPVLVLHIKRFLYDVAADSIVKINKPVQFAPELEIPLGIMAPIAGKFTEPVCYKLYGVLYHHGKSVGSGNYTVDVLHPNGDSGNGEAWLHIDDEVVSTLQHEDVFGGGGSERVDDRCVYMLFYCRTAPTQT